MKYVCLCYGEERRMKEMPRAEWDAIGNEAHAYREELRTRGHLIAAQSLQSVDTATTVRVRNGKVLTSDGPFAQTREQLDGIFLIEAQDLNEAIQLASRLVGARLGCIEVRPAKEVC